jgi:hypothetical protein
VDRRRQTRGGELLPDLRAQALKVASRALIWTRAHRKVVCYDSVNCPLDVGDCRRYGIVPYGNVYSPIVLQQVDRPGAGVLAKNLARGLRIELHLKRQFCPVQSLVLFWVFATIHRFKVDHPRIDNISPWIVVEK